MLDFLCRYSRFLARRRHRYAVKCWYRDGGKSRRYAYDLNGDSVVLDIGGFEGTFAAEINARFSCHLHIFEPVSAYHRALSANFRGSSKVRVHPFGLGGRSERVNMELSGDRSTHVGHEVVATGTEEVEIRAFDDWLKESAITNIDLMNVNIEGAEFELMEHLIAGGHLLKIRDLQIQFHLFAPDAVTRRARLRAALQQTHRLTYDYFFTWENWQRIESLPKP